MELVAASGLVLTVPWLQEHMTSAFQVLGMSLTLEASIGFISYTTE